MAEKTVPPDLDHRLFRKLRTIDDATSGRDLRVPSGNRFEKLRGNLKVFRSIRVNRQWRIVFQWDNVRGAASYVCLDGHIY